MRSSNDRIRFGSLAISLTIAVSLSASFTINAQSTPAWTELGPDNMGGRTRALLFDNQDATHTHMFAGSVTGGLFESNNAGNDWHRCTGWFAQPNVFNTIDCIAQAPNGDIYVGTGEGQFYLPYGNGAGGFIGGGIYKSSDDGISWSLLSSTQPSQPNSDFAAWAEIGRIACDPVNSNIVYAATNKGLHISYDGGNSWNSPAGPSTSINSTDVVVGSDRHVIAVCGNKPWISSDTGMTFTNVGTTVNGFTNATLGRVEVAIAPSDPRIVYATAIDGTGDLLGMFVSLDGGNHWTQFCGAGNSFFDPWGQGLGATFGTFCNALAVDPSDKYRLIVGGIQLWKWEMSDTINVAGQWSRIALETEFPLNPFYVGEDKHVILYRPGYPSSFYIGCDRGLFRTTDGGSTYAPINSGYNTVQCFSVGFDHSSANRNNVLLGTQDQGSMIIDGTGNTPMSAHKILEIPNGTGEARSFIDQNCIFVGSLQGVVNKSQTNGNVLVNAYSNAMYLNMPVGTAAFSSFLTPMDLWESLHDTLTHDTVMWINVQHTLSIAIGDGSTTTYSGTLPAVIPVTNPAGTIDLSTVRFFVGSDTIFSDASGNLSGGGTGTISSNGTYSFTFFSAPASQYVIHAAFFMDYTAGTVFPMNSGVRNTVFNYSSPAAVLPGDTLWAQNVIQSHLAIGFSSTYGVWINRNALEFMYEPLWIKIGGMNSAPDAFSGVSSALKWTPDGDHLFVGTENGGVYRFDHLAAITDTTNGSVDLYNGPNPACIVTCTRIGAFTARTVTDLDIDPNDPNNVIVSLGDYGNTQYVYVSTNAMTATSTVGTFTNATSNLTAMGAVPVYSVSFDIYHSGRVLAGTEHGVYETDDIFTATPNWVDYNTGFDKVPVEMISQQRRESWNVPNSGCFYVASHGRGVWRDDASWQPMTGINEPSLSNSSNSLQNDLLVFPNPANDKTEVDFNLPKATDVVVKIYDAEGKLCASFPFNDLSKGSNRIPLDLSSLNAGVYLLVVDTSDARIGYARIIHSR